MPAFEFQDPDSGEVIERRLTFSKKLRFEEIRTGSGPLVEDSELNEFRELGILRKDGIFLTPVISGSKKSKGAAPRTVLRGEDFPSKRFTVRRQMELRKKRARRRGFKDLPDPTKAGLCPNVEGEEAKDWTEAKEMARKKGYTAEQLATYDKAIQQEQELKNEHEQDYEQVR